MIARARPTRSAIIAVRPSAPGSVAAASEQNFATLSHIARPIPSFSIDQPPRNAADIHGETANIDCSMPDDAARAFAGAPLKSPDDIAEEEHDISHDRQPEHADGNVVRNHADELPDDRKHREKHRDEKRQGCGRREIHLIFPIFSGLAATPRVRLSPERAERGLLTVARDHIACPTIMEGEQS
jgi:hypothetical protein